jgi:uncharacterized membrane protein
LFPSNASAALANRLIKSANCISSLTLFDDINASLYIFMMLHVYWINIFGGTEKKKKKKNRNKKEKTQKEEKEEKNSAEHSPCFR